MHSRHQHQQRGNALVMSIIVVLVITVAGVGIIRFVSREMAGAHAGRKEAAIEACAEAARAMLMSRWKVLGTVGIPPVDETLEPSGPTKIKGGHYGDEPTPYYNELTQTWIKNVQVMPLNPRTLGNAFQADDITNRIGEAALPYRVVVHCVQGTDVNAREVEVEFGLRYGL